MPRLFALGLVVVVLLALAFVPAVALAQSTGSGVLACVPASGSTTAVRAGDCAINALPGDMIQAAPGPEGSGGIIVINFTGRQIPIIIDRDRPGSAGGQLGCSPLDPRGC